VPRVLLGGVLIAITLAVTPISGATVAASSGIVASVYDGDTLSLSDGRRVRLLQIDTRSVSSRGHGHQRPAHEEPASEREVRSQLRRGMRSAVPARPRLRRPPGAGTCAGQEQDSDPHGLDGIGCE
jgi:hypothetical protein